MGATESTLYDDASMQTQRPMHDDTSIQTQRPMALPPQPLPSPVIHGGAAMIQRKQQPQKPPRKRVPPSQAKPIKRMEGLVLGGPKTGKRTLLSRLKGVDPFVAKQQEKLNKANEKEEVNPSITIQYKPPSESPTWDRIKLRIRYANRIDNSNTNAKNDNATNSQIDFVVLLISPKDSRETTQSYVESILAMYLDRLGHRKAVEGGDNENEEEETETDVGSHGTNVTEPFCIAILFNFRDLEEGKEEEKVASRDDLRLLVENMLRSRNVQERKAVIELLETSLLNCYGLDGLHRFIYRTYLQRCQTDIERQLDVVRKQIELTNVKNDQKAGDNTAEAKAMAYSEFLKENAPKEEAPPPPQDKPKHGTEEDGRQEETVPRRMNFRTPRKQVPALRMGKDALEAFLASSSDEEDTKQSATTSHRIKFSKTGENGYSSSSDDESDDDFFYDESGNRRHQIQNPDTRRSANPVSDRKEILDDSSDDSSSSEEDNEKDESQVVYSPRKASFENSNQLKHQDKKSQTPQQTPRVKDSTPIEEKMVDKDQVEDMTNDRSIQGENTSGIHTMNTEEELVNEEDTNEANFPRNASDRHGETIEGSPKKDSSDENSIYSDTDVANKAGEVDDETNNAVTESDIVNNDGDDAGSFKEISSKGSNGGANDDVGSLDASANDIDNGINCNSDIGNSDAYNGISEENDVDNDVPTRPSLSIEYDDNDDYMIGSPPGTTNVAEDSDDDDGGGYMINATPNDENVGQDDYDDDDEVNMIGSAPAVEKVIEGEDNDEDSHMINSTPNAGSFTQDDSDGEDDGYMIGSTSGAENVVQDDDDDDDDDDGFIIGHTSVEGDNAIKEDDSDSDFMIQSNPIEDGNNNTEDSPETRLSSSQFIGKPSRSSAAADKGPEEENDPQSSKESAASGGISQAALAAIAAAQQEAEAMMRQQQQQHRQQQQYSELPSNMVKEKKSKKKKKDEKKKKKKKKSKGLDDE